MNFHFYLQNKVTQRTGNKATEFHNNLEFTDNHRGVVSLETHFAGIPDADFFVVVNQSINQTTFIRLKSNKHSKYNSG